MIIFFTFLFHLIVTVIETVSDILNLSKDVSNSESVMAKVSSSAAVHLWNHMLIKEAFGSWENVTLEWR